MIHIEPWPSVLPAQPTPADLLAILTRARWLASVGHPSDADHAVTREHSWQAAAAALDAPESTSGTLDAPSYEILQCLDAEESQQTAQLADSAARDAVAALTLSQHIPAGLPLDVDVTIGDALTAYVRFLHLEVFAAARLGATCTYFRGQLPWFVAGLLPCGWAGEWPAGRLRVF